MFTVIQWALDWDEHMNATPWIFHVLRQSFPWINILTHLNGVRECSVSDTTLSSVLREGSLPCGAVECDLVGGKQEAPG